MLHRDAARVNKADSFFLRVAITLPHVAGSRWVQRDSNMLLSPSAPREERELSPHFLFFFFFLFCTSLCLYLLHIFKLCLEVSAAKNVSSPPRRTCLGMTHYFFLGMLWNECPQINAKNISFHAVFFFLCQDMLWSSSHFLRKWHRNTLQYALNCFKYACKHSRFSLMLTFIHFIGICVYLMWFCSFLCKYQTQKSAPADCNGNRWVFWAAAALEWYLEVSTTSGKISVSPPLHMLTSKTILAS